MTFAGQLSSKSAGNRVGADFLPESALRAHNSLGIVKKLFQVRPFAALLVLILGLTGCSVFEGYVEPVAEVETLPPAAERPRLEPINRNYFALNSPQQTVVGEPQLVFTSAEDTFSDIAREYGLGYDELVASNPDVAAAGILPEAHFLDFGLRERRRCGPRCTVTPLPTGETPDAGGREEQVVEEFAWSDRTYRVTTVSDSVVRQVQAQSEIDPDVAAV